MITDPHSLVTATIAALQQMPAAERALAAGDLIAAVQGEGDRRIARIRWAAIAEMYDSGLRVEEIAMTLMITAGSVDLAIQSHHRYTPEPVPVSRYAM